MSFSQGFNQVSRRAAEGFPGQVVSDSQLRRYSSGINQAPQRVNIWTVTVGSDPGDDVDGTLTFNFGDGDIDVAFNTGTGADTTGIATAIAAAVNAEPLVRGRVEATSAAAVVTLTGRNTGVSFTPTEAESFLNTPSETQTALVADDILIPRAVIVTGHNTTNPADEPDLLVALAEETNFSAQVQTLTVDTGEAGDKTVTIYEVRGSERVIIGQEVYAGNVTANTEADNLRTAINAAAPANTVLAAGSSPNVTVTAEIAGLEFDVVVSSAGTSKVATTGPSRATSLHRAWGGITSYSLQDEAAVIGGTQGRYPANHGVVFLQEGEIVVDTTEAVVYGDPVFVELGTTDTGKLYKTAGADRVQLAADRAQWVRKTADGLSFGIIQLTYQG